jgi:hypothetical protein
MKSHSEGAKPFHVDRQTHRHDEANNNFSQFRSYRNTVFVQIYFEKYLSGRVVQSVVQGLRVQIPTGAWTPVSCYCCVLSVRGLCIQLITLLAESYTV